MPHTEKIISWNVALLAHAKFNEMSSSGILILIQKSCLTMTISLTVGSLNEITADSQSKFSS